MLEFVSWYLFILFLGLITFPITFYVFDKANDKGFSVSKIFGLVLWGFIYWIGNLSYLIGNNRSGVIWSLLILIGISAVFLSRQETKNIAQWVKENRKICISIELIFLLFFMFWAFIRAISPEILGTEKPMELAFINAIIRSPTFPPNDPWLSGYAISYYYFGYILVVLFIKILGTNSGIAFNLAISIWIAMVASASYGILFNLLIKRPRHSDSVTNPKTLNKILLLSVLAPLFIIFLSNAEGFLELIHSRGFFWEESNNGVMESAFWKNLDIKELAEPPTEPFHWKISRPGGVWWWRASRVLQDYTVDGQPREIIDEFPFFSFYLADLHPHVLVLPFSLLCVYFGMQFAFNPEFLFKEKFIILEIIRNPKYWFLVICLGSIIFINIWDFPLCFLLIICAGFISNLKRLFNIKNLGIHFILFSTTLGISCLLLFFPFLITFSSQAGGVLPSLVFRTRIIHFFVMFFPQLLISIFFIAFYIVPEISKKTSIIYVGIGLGISIILFFLSILFALIIGNFTQLFTDIFLDGTEKNIETLKQTFLSIYGSDNFVDLINTTMNRRLHDSWVVIMLVLIIGISLVVIFEGRNKVQKTRDDYISLQYIFLLVILSCLLCLFPEFFYLKDQFGWRMNTIFKFYYQAWIFFGIAVAYMVLSTNQFKNGRNPIFIYISVFSIAIGLVYPIFAFIDKFSIIDLKKLSLDGYNYIKQSNPSEYEAIEFLDSMPYGVVSEAIGGSYSGYGRISMLTGLPTVLGWTGHELQWRGGVKEMANRETDIRDLYTTDKWDIALSIINRYQIDYIYIGDIEKRTYKINSDKFYNYLFSVFNNGRVEIFSTKVLN